MPENKPVDAIETMVGLGPKSCQWLREAGITTADQVRSHGAVECYVRVVRLRTIKPSLNLLWALQGGIEELHWTFIEPKQREQLRAELEHRLAQEQPSTQA